MRDAARINMRASPLTFVAVFLPFAAAAQTSGTIDALAAIQQYEDASGDPTALNYAYGPNNTAAGLYQINISTYNPIAQQLGLPQVGPGTSYANVGALSVEQQQEAAAYLYQTQGLQPWLCCNTALASYVANQGGTSAFGLTSSETALLDGTTVTVGGGD